MFSADMWFLHVCKVTEREGEGGVGERGAVSFYNYPWRDMTCPDIDYCLDIVQVMESHLSLGQKVLNLQHRSSSRCLFYQTWHSA
jgi:hypothetical protein